MPPPARAAGLPEPQSFTGGAHTCFACHEVVKSHDLVFNHYAA
jgi:hypothetical protein